MGWKEGLDPKLIYVTQQKNWSRDSMWVCIIQHASELAICLLCL